MRLPPVEFLYMHTPEDDLATSMHYAGAYVLNRHSQSSRRNQRTLIGTWEAIHTAAESSHSALQLKLKMNTPHSCISMTCC